MVAERNFGNHAVFICEICGYGYQSIPLAEQCEQHCDSQSRSSRRIRNKAIYHPPVEILPTVAQ